MIMKKVFIAAIAACLLGLMSCTENTRARSFGGEMTVELPKGEKLLSATWKGTDLFYLTEPMSETDVPKVKYFREISDLGILETTVKFVESK